MKLDLKDIKTQMDWMKNNLTNEDKMHIKIYTSPTGYTINKQLRGKNPLLKPFMALTNYLKKYLQSSIQ